MDAEMSEKMEDHPSETSMTASSSESNEGKTIF